MFRNVGKNIIYTDDVGFFLSCTYNLFIKLDYTCIIFQPVLLLIHLFVCPVSPPLSGTMSSASDTSVI